jgi:hypothetical protein
MAEQWRKIPDAEYEVSDLGRIASLKFGRRKVMRPGKDSAGYPHVKMGVRRKTICVKVHILVATVFLGPKPTPLHEVNHKNGVKADARAENLEWVTHRENIQHGLSVLGNKRARGEQIGIHKMTPSEVRRMRARLAEGARQVDLAKEFGVSQPTVSAVKVGRCWRWVE